VFQQRVWRKILKERDLIGLFFAGVLTAGMALIAQPANSFWMNVKVAVLVFSAALIVGSLVALLALRKRRSRNRES
jgi:uncharacterized membrane protein YesL